MSTLVAGCDPDTDRSAWSDDAATAARASRSFPAIGTTATVVVTALARADRAAELLAAELAALDATCSRFRDDSELRRVERLAAGRPTPVSRLLFDALETAVATAVRTAGTVDPTIGSALADLGYDRDFAGIVPDPEAAGPPAPAPGWWRIQLDPTLCTVTIPEGVHVDLGSSAKAFAADRAAARISRELDCGVLVNLGGDVAVAGEPPDGGWGVGIAPVCTAPPTAIDEVVALRSGGLATSGTTSRTWERGGRTVHHILDPTTGGPAPSDLGAGVGRRAELRRGQRVDDCRRRLGGRRPGQPRRPRSRSPPGCSRRHGGQGRGMAGVTRGRSRPGPDGAGPMIAVTSTAWTTDVWYTMRATGAVALVLLSLTVVLGILTAGRVRTRSWPAFAQAELHKRISLLAMVFLVLHVLTAVLDSYVDVGWAAALVPFASPYRPLWTGLGTVAVDLLVAVAVSSALRQRISPRTWRGIHWLAYGSWPVAMAHSLGMGTDASQLWMDASAGLCSAGVLVALGWRLGDRRAARLEAERVGAVTRAVPLRHRGRSPDTALPTGGSEPTGAPDRTATRLLERTSR